MKKICLLAVWLSSMFLITACNDFLDVKPRDKKVVTNVEDYRDIMASYMDFLKTPARPQIPLFGISAFTFPYFDVSTNLGVYTGEVNLKKTSFAYYDTKKSEYTEEGKTLLTWLNTDPYVWDGYYKFLGPINLVISGIETADGNDENLRNYVKGEALVWRAFAYYKLLQYYSPYKNNIYGVPVYLKPYEDVGNAMPARNTQQEVFARILGDLGEVMRLLEVTSSSEWNCAYRSDFVHAMLASIYTWKAMSGAAEDSDWHNAELHATAAMTGRSLTDSPDILREMFDCRDVTLQTSMDNDEFYFRIIDGSNNYIFDFISSYYEDNSVLYGSSSVADGLVNQEYYQLFSDDDIRKSVYFTLDGMRSDKYNLLGVRGLMGNGGGGCLMLFRLAEMYLIKAEALLRQGKIGEARSVLQEFKSARYTGEQNVPADKDALLTEILNERSREFYMENDARWLEMKRNEVQVNRTIGGGKYILQPDDFRYSFPIPRKEMELNRNMVQTPGWENIILN